MDILSETDGVTFFSFFSYALKSVPTLNGLFLWNEENIKETYSFHPIQDVHVREWHGNLGGLVEYNKVEWKKMIAYF